jgi:hypothetical protein
MAMLVLEGGLDDRVDTLSRALWGARKIALSGAFSFNPLGVAGVLDFLLPVIKQLDEGRAGEDDVQLLFVIGREIDGVEQFWDGNMPLNAELEKCVDVYLIAVHRARQAALQAIVLLRHMVYKDVAVLIAKRVYQTRSEAFMWYMPI